MEGWTDAGPWFNKNWKRTEKNKPWRHNLLSCLQSWLAMYFEHSNLKCWETLDLGRDSKLWKSNFEIPFTLKPLKHFLKNFCWPQHYHSWNQWEQRLSFSLGVQVIHTWCKLWLCPLEAATSRGDKKSIPTAAPWSEVTGICPWGFTTGLQQRSWRPLVVILCPCSYETRTSSHARRPWTCAAPYKPQRRWLQAYWSPVKEQRNIDVLLMSELLAN